MLPTCIPRPAAARSTRVNDVVYADVNNGVYRCGFAGSQHSYERAFDRLFARLDWLSERLSHQRYLVGDTITEADVRLFTTLVRFDAVYHGHFKCNRQKLSELPILWAYARDLFQTPGFGDTIDFVHIKRHYYEVHRDINPTGIVPLGPALDGWRMPHGRADLGGRPFGDGTPPGSADTRGARAGRQRRLKVNSRHGGRCGCRRSVTRAGRRPRSPLQELAAQDEQLGRRFTIAPRVGVEHPLVGLPLLAHA